MLNNDEDDDEVVKSKILKTMKILVLFLSIIRHYSLRNGIKKTFQTFKVSTFYLYFLSVYLVKCVH